MRECFGQTELVATLCTFPWMKICPGSMGKPAPHVRRRPRWTKMTRAARPVRSARSWCARSTRPARWACSWATTAMRSCTTAVWHDGMYHTARPRLARRVGLLLVRGPRGRRYKVLGLPHRAVRGGERADGARRPCWRCAITAVPDPVRGQVVKATIVLTRDYKD